MPEIKFLPSGQVVTVDADTKLLVAAIRHKVGIRYGCAACQCGSCAVAIISDAPLEAIVSPMQGDERALLERMRLATDGSVRLACRTKLQAGCLSVDLSFQDSYSPDQAE